MAKVYSAHEKWTRLRVLGWEKDCDGDIVAEANLIFTPLKQRLPVLDETTNPEMEDPIMGQILGDHNTIKGLCELRSPWYFCNMLQVSPTVLGSRIKYLLRCSNDSYPDILADVQGTPDLYITEVKKLQTLEKLPGNRHCLEIQAYDEIIVIMGGAIGHKAYWPRSYPVKEREETAVCIREDRTYSTKRYKWTADDIVLSVTVSVEQLGSLLLRVWAAKQYLPNPPPSEFTAFWQRITD